MPDILSFEKLNTVNKLAFAMWPSMQVGHIVHPSFPYGPQSRKQKSVKEPKFA